jgi:transcriptional regulator with XRE-family HTH domain
MAQRDQTPRVRRQIRLVTFGPDKREAEEAMLAFGTNLRTLRVAKHLSQETLAMRCFLRRALMGEIESGRRSPDVPALLTLADRLNVPAAELLAGVQAPVRRVGTAKVLDLITQHPGIKHDSLVTLSRLPDWYGAEITVYLQSVGAIGRAQRGWELASGETSSHTAQ